jgi:hypothetical protein
MDSLEFLLNSDEGEGAQFNDGGVSTWNANAFNTMPRDKWLVLKVPQANRSHVMCDFCDGDDLNGKEWLGGPFSQSLTIRELIEYQQDSDRGRRRACADNLLRKAHVRKRRDDSFSKKKEEPRQKSSSSDGGKGSELNEGTQTRSEWISDFQRRVAPYRPIDLLESERKRKRLSEINLPVLMSEYRCYGLTTL